MHKSLQNKHLFCFDFLDRQKLSICQRHQAFERKVSVCICLHLKTGAASVSKQRTKPSSNSKIANRYQIQQCVFFHSQKNWPASVSIRLKMYDISVIHEAPFLNGYNYSDYFNFMECYIEYLAGLELIHSPKLEESDEDRELLHDHLKFVLKRTVNKEHRNLIKPGDSVFVIWHRLKLQEANFNRLIAHQELTHQILYLRRSILKIDQKKELLNRKRKLEEDAVQVMKVIKKERLSFPEP